MSVSKEELQRRRYEKGRAATKGDQSPEGVAEAVLPMPQSADSPASCTERQRSS